MLRLLLTPARLRMYPHLRPLVFLTLARPFFTHHFAQLSLFKGILCRKSVLCRNYNNFAEIGFSFRKQMIRKHTRNPVRVLKEQYRTHSCREISLYWKPGNFSYHGTEVRMLDQNLGGVGFLCWKTQQTTLSRSLSLQLDLPHKAVVRRIWGEEKPCMLFWAHWKESGI